jgi:tRNA-dihydrouridine synthase
MGSWPDEIARGAEILAAMGHEVIDVNLACPVKKIKRKARGGHFLAFPEEAIGVLRAVREAVPANIPCTVKLRRSFDDTPEMAHAFEQIFEASYEMGYVWATVHCRTVQQKYAGPGRWEFLRDLMKRRPDRTLRLIMNPMARR